MTLTRKEQRQVEKATKARAKLVRDDLLGTDGDIASLVRLLQDRYACSHSEAEAELVRRVSSGRDPRGYGVRRSPVAGGL